MEIQIKSTPSQQAVRESRAYHTCHELITVCLTPNGGMYFKDSSGKHITVCPDCFKDIELWDLHTSENFLGE